MNRLVFERALQEQTGILLRSNQRPQAAVSFLATDCADCADCCVGWQNNLHPIFPIREIRSQDFVWCSNDACHFVVNFVDKAYDKAYDKDADRLAFPKNKKGRASARPTE